MGTFGFASPSQAPRRQNDGRQHVERRELGRDGENVPQAHGVASWLGLGASDAVTPPWGLGSGNGTHCDNGRGSVILRMSYQSGFNGPLLGPFQTVCSWSTVTTISSF